MEWFGRDERGMAPGAGDATRCVLPTIATSDWRARIPPIVPFEPGDAPDRGIRLASARNACLKVPLMIMTITGTVN